MSISQNGRLCAATYLNILVDGIIKSKFSYVDEYSNICYNFVVLISKYSGLTADDLFNVNYDKNNCSFVILSACVGKNSRNVTVPTLGKSDCEKGE